MLLTLELLGGIGLFLLGMNLLTDGLKLAAGDGLRAILRRWTGTPVRGLFAGAFLTGIVQSSSATTVATIGFVNAGLLTLSHAVWVIFGANVGTTMTGWLVSLIGLRIDVSAMALPFIGIGMLGRLVSASRPRASGIGQAVAGFGLFFLGIGILKDGFGELIPQLSFLDPSDLGFFGPFVFLMLGAGMSFLTQSSSAAVAILLTATAGGAIPIELAAASIIGADVGTTSTAAYASLSATPAAKRAAAAQILFNIATGVLAFILLPVLLPAAKAITGAIFEDAGDTVALAAFHTLFNLIGVAVWFPFAGLLIRRLQTMFVSPDEAIGRPQFLDPTLAEVPAVALRGLLLEVDRMMRVAFERATARLETPGAGGRDGTHEAGVLALGQAIRDFISQLSRAALPSETVEALPDIIRCVQHIEEVATESRALLAEIRLPDAASDDARWSRLQAGVVATLQTSTETPDAFKSEFDMEMNEVEDAYQAIKKDLLEAVASGRLAVSDAEAALVKAQRLRRVAEAALKAERRVAPWMGLTAARVASGADAA
ncbi:MAG: Na/Pi cotransporter family protein [Hyphomonas sp.]|uniref:Na/Pi symporter n=1 Tax=Hyphomonas sp. TaxID=87 RepID=UPI00183D8509|nr:Na/Pi symporter [Hyphomonas sp.]MBA3069786.1 Na/Pi cotransporter family protein [Hyphomonas sp.]MBU3920921.1 Na/Pi symporter [Alphaproteobacteria bacterium]MBU4062627.1 Na/Pi symporter [Alphaproteobacteria bacterium]MBU4163978.1 Na/Pi symporter [Alphaproteobacteria bacterium]